MRGTPQAGFSAAMRTMSSRNSLPTHFLPARVGCRESHAQYNLNPARCQRTTVSGWTRIKACFHPGQSRRSTTQNNLPEAGIRGCGCRRFKVVSCCRSARFSKSRPWPEWKKRTGKTDKSLNQRSMRPVYTAQTKLRVPAICLI